METNGLNTVWRGLGRRVSSRGGSSGVGSGSGGVARGSAGSGGAAGTGAMRSAAARTSGGGGSAGTESGDRNVPDDRSLLRADETAKCSSGEGGGGGSGLIYPPTLIPVGGFNRD
jgi:hypothetical protein